MSRQLAAILRKTHLLQEPEIAASIELAARNNESLWQVLLKRPDVSEEQLAEAMAEHLKLPYIKLSSLVIDPDAVRLIPEEMARRLTAIAIRIEHLVKDTPAHELAKKRVTEFGTDAAAKRRPLLLAMADPSDFIAIQDLEFASGCSVKPVVATKTEIDEAITRHYSFDTWIHDFLQNVEPKGDLEILSQDEENDLWIVSKANKLQEAPAVKLVNLILQNAIRQRVSDVHIEPGMHHVRVRMRIEGMLCESMQVPKWLQDPLVSRIKILAKLNIADRRVPQDGRIRVVYEKVDVDLRVSTLPTFYGEKVVMRVLGSGKRVPSLSTLGMDEEQMQMLKRATDQPQGLVLVTGPTGSGKTTTLYSILDRKKSPSINILTVEDPVEIQLQGINQVQVNVKAGLTFASTLRSMLRQDPDVILVGEIRDLETAEIVFHAAQTGHLAFSTLHTNSTTATLGRLLDIGIEPYLISSAVNLIVAQRLIRTICPQCKTTYEPDLEALALLRLNMPEYFHGSGCDSCNGTGYAGRVAVYEMLRFTTRMREIIGAKAGEVELRRAAIADGLRTLLHEGIEKIKAGITTPEEILRVIEVQEEDQSFACGNCHRGIEESFTLCPYCEHTLKVVCAGCHKDMKAGWKRCPYCGHPQASHVPSVPARKAAPAADQNPAQDSDWTPRILVIDDDEIMRTITTAALSQLEGGCEVLAAPDGPSGLKAIHKHRPDLIILDVQMPGMSGIEVCQALRKELETAFIPVIMLTADTGDESRLSSFLAGTDGYMAKPFAIPELHARVTHLLQRAYHRGQDESNLPAH